MIERLTSVTTADAPHLADLLADAVADGASVGYYAPLDPALATEFAQGVAAAVAAGSRILLVVRDAGRIVGSVQLDLAVKPTAAHRAEVMKLLVHTSHRRRGLGEALLRAAEAEAIRLGRTLLVLDTRAGDPSCHLYEKLGYTLTGVVPGYAANSAGGYDACAFYHRVLGGGSS